jgi:hypothetical protein
MMDNSILIQQSLDGLVEVIKHASEKDLLDKFGILMPSILSGLSVLLLIIIFLLNQKAVNKNSVDNEICREHIKMIFDLYKWLNSNKYLFQIYHAKKMTINGKDISNDAQIKYSLVDLIINTPEELSVLFKMQVIMDEHFYNDLLFPKFSENIFLPCNIRFLMRKMRYDRIHYKYVNESELEDTYVYIGKSDHGMMDVGEYFVVKKSLEKLKDDFRNIYLESIRWQEKPKPMLDLISNLT